MGSILYVVYGISHMKGIQREVFSEYVCNWYVNCHIKWHMEQMKNRMKCLRLMLRQQHPPATSLLKYTNHYNIVITRTCT